MFLGIRTIEVVSEKNGVTWQSLENILWRSASGCRSEIIDHYITFYILFYPIPSSDIIGQFYLHILSPCPIYLWKLCQMIKQKKCREHHFLLGLLLRWGKEATIAMTFSVILRSQQCSWSDFTSNVMYSTTGQFENSQEPSVPCSWS